ncbi:MAG: hypothetical protein Q4G58_12120 [bacterium]|nr:hypothetical protein [bacterium]
MKNGKHIRKLLTVGAFFLVLSMGKKISYAGSTETTVYVDAAAATGGNGSSSKPYASIQTALDSLEEGAGGKVLLRAGTYKEKVTMKKNGSKETPITIAPYNGETVIINGQGSNGVLFHLNGKSNIVIDQLEFCNMQGTTSGVAIAIMGVGKEDNITIKNCEIYEINAKNPANCNADAISIRAANGKSSNINILNNHIHDCETGWSEAVVLNGYVDGAVIKGNKIEHIGNIGIDIAGHYGVYKDSAYDQARNVLIADNVIDDCVSPNCVSSAGIYCDGGRNVTIENNIVTNSQVGIGIGCEEADRGYPVTDIIINNNAVYNTSYAAFDIGGYSSKSGTVQQVVVTNNTFYTNNSNNSAIHFTKLKDAHFERNLIATPKRTIMSLDVNQSNISNVTFKDNLFSTAYRLISEVTLYISGVSGNAPFVGYIKDAKYLTLSEIQVTQAYDTNTGYGYQSSIKEPEAGAGDTEDKDERPSHDEDQTPGEDQKPETEKLTLLFDAFEEGKILNSISQADFILNATAKKTMEVIKGEYKAADGTRFTSKLRLNGAGSMTTRNIQFTASKDKTIISFYAANTSTTGAIQLINETGEIVRSVAIGTAIKQYTFENLAAGNYYLVADGGNMTAYSVSLSW